MFCPAIHSENDRQIGMKSFGNLIISFGREQKAARLSRCLAPMLAGAFLAAGCHKAPDAAPPPTTPATVAAPDTNQNNEASAPVTVTQPPPGPPQPTPHPLADPEAPPVARPNGEADLHQLDVSIMHWVFAHQRAPSSFAEYASSADVTVPPPPPGKKYAFGPHYHAILVDANQH
jgi:hypothetical protein